MARRHITESELVQFALGRFQAIDANARAFIAAERQRVGSPIACWFDDLKQKSAHPLSIDWFALATYASDSTRILTSLRANIDSGKYTGINQNRMVVEATLRELGELAEPTTPAALVSFLDAAKAMQLLLRQVAGEQASAKPSETETVKQIHTTIAMAQSDPLRTLRRDRRLVELDQVDSERATIYRLHVFAGCSDREVAAMLEMPFEVVAVSRRLATAAVGIDDDATQ